MSAILAFDVNIFLVLTSFVEIVIVVASNHCYIINLF